MENDSEIVLYSKASDTTNVNLQKNTLHVCHLGSTTDEKYWDEIFASHVTPYIGAIRHGFILMDGFILMYEISELYLLMNNMRIKIWSERNAQLNLLNVIPKSIFQTTPEDRWLPEVFLRDL